jgi:hypothetical protein
LRNLLLLLLLLSSEKSGASKYKEENPITTGTQASDSSSLQILVKICLLSSESCKKFSDGSK